MNKLETYQDFINSLISGGILYQVKCIKCYWISYISPRIKDRYFCPKCGFEHNEEDN